MECQGGGGLIKIKEKYPIERQRGDTKFKTSAGIERQKGDEISRQVLYENITLTGTAMEHQVAVRNSWQVYHRNVKGVLQIRDKYSNGMRKR